MRNVTACAVLGLGLGLLTCGVVFAQTASPAPVASSAPTDPPSGNATPAVTPSPAPSATPAYRFVYRATPSPDTTPFPRPGAPEIQEIDLSDSTLVPPANIYGRILTNAEVVKVSAETMGADLDIPKQSPGVFGLAASIPSVPGFLRNREFDVTFTATVADGRVASVTLPLTIR